MVEKAEKIIKKIKKNISKVLNEIKYIDEILRRKALAQLQRNYGLILVPKEDIIITNDQEIAEEDESFLYEWDPEFFKKSYRIPKFREKIEKVIAMAYDELDELIGKNETEKYENRKEKLRKKIKNMLKTPNEWYDKLMNDLSERIETIFPYYSYLDTNERKIIENLEERSSEYCKILDELNERSELNLIID